jgi:hypothetical protein
MKRKSKVKMADLTPSHVPDYLRFKTKDEAQLAAYKRELDIHWSNKVIDEFVVIKNPTKKQYAKALFEIADLLSKWQ